MARNLTVDQRKWILKEYWESENAESVRRKWEQQFGTKPPRRQTIYKIRNKFEKTGSLQNAPKSGRPVTVTTEENARLVAGALSSSPNKSQRKVAQELGISRKSLHVLLRRHGTKIGHPVQRCSMVAQQKTPSPSTHLTTTNAQEGQRSTPPLLSLSMSESVYRPPPEMTPMDMLWNVVQSSVFSRNPTSVESMKQYIADALQALDSNKELCRWVNSNVQERQQDSVNQQGQQNSVTQQEGQQNSVAQQEGQQDSVTPQNGQQDSVTIMQPQQQEGQQNSITMQERQQDGSVTQLVEQQDIVSQPENQQNSVTRQEELQNFVTLQETLQAPIVTLQEGPHIPILTLQEKLQDHIVTVPEKLQEPVVTLQSGLPEPVVTLHETLQEPVVIHDPEFEHQPE